MHKLSRLRAIAIITLAFFLFNCILPYEAMAYHVGPWSIGGQLLGAITGANFRFGDNQPRFEPIRNWAFCAKPVSLINGQEVYECTDMVIPGRGMDVEIKHIYRSSNNFNNQFGYGWSLNYYERMKPMSDGNVLRLGASTHRMETYSYDGTKYNAPAGYFETPVMNGDGTWTITKADGKAYRYDMNGNLSSITDRNGNQISFTYDAVGAMPILGFRKFSATPTVSEVIGFDYRLVKITDTLGRDINLSYDSDGRLASITDFNGRVVSYTYNPLTNDLLTITKPATAEYPSGVTKTFTYDANHNLLTIRDQKGQVFVTNTYNSQGKVSQQTLGSGSYQFSYGVNQTTVTDRKGYVTTYTFNAAGNATRVERFTAGVRAGDPGSFITDYTYNTDMLKTSETYPNGNGVKYVYDSANPNRKARGNLLQVRKKTSMAAADNDAVDLVWNITYESQFNQPKTITDPKGNVYTLLYDYELPPTDPKYGTKGNLVKITYPAVGGQSPVVDLSYNSYGQVTEVRDPNGNITQYGYFPTTGYLQTVTRDPGGINAVTQITYDVYGNVNTVTDPNNHVTDYDYNALHWLVQERNPLNFLTKYTRDQNGNVTKVERQADAGATQWQVVQFTYDVLNNLKTITDPLNRVTTYNYDNNENVISMVDANAKTTSYQYDERDFLFKVTDANTPSAGVTQYDYDNNGNLKKILDAKSQATNYMYDLYDRLDVMTYADGSAVNYDYDKNSNLDFVTLPGAYGTIDYVYDELNRLTASHFPLHASLDKTFQYDLGSRLTSANTTSAQNSYTYDALNRVLTNVHQLATNVYTLTYQYDSASNRTRLTYPSGKVIDYTYDANDNIDLVKVNSVTLTDYNYDPLDRRTTKTFPTTSPQQQATYNFDIANQLLSLTNTVLPATPISIYSYTYDNVGNRLSMIAPSGTHNYSYNNIYELTGVSGAQTHSFAYDKVANRTTADGVTYTSNNINQYSQVGAQPYTYDANGNLTNDGTTTFTYDEENRLTTATKAGMTANYGYDAFNRRISKTVNGTAEYFIYDGDDIIEDRSSAGTLTADYVHGSDIDEVLTMSRSGQTYYYHHDGLGSVTEITNPTGITVENYSYDVYGQPSIITSSIGNRYRFTGREFDEETGLYYYRRRQYSSERGRFSQRDPLGYRDSMSLYEYAVNNPVNITDPFGLQGMQMTHPIIIPSPAPIITTPVITPSVVSQSPSTIVPVLPTTTISVPNVSIPSSEPQVQNPQDSSNQESETPPESKDRKRGRQDPTKHGPVNPGRGADGVCNPCPDNEYWNVDEPGHGCDTHWHGIEWNQDQETCMCYPKRVSGGGKK